MTAGPRWERLIAHKLTHQESTMLMYLNNTLEKGGSPKVVLLPFHLHLSYG